jgi:hypothetical protein
MKPCVIGEDPWKGGKFSICIWDDPGIIAVGRCEHQALRNKVLNDPSLTIEQRQALQRNFRNFVDGFVAGEELVIRDGGGTIENLHRALLTCSKAWPEHDNDMRYATDNAKVRRLALEHGENWRICPAPLKEELGDHLRAYARPIAGGNGEYFYDVETGSCVLTADNVDRARKGTPEQARMALDDIMNRLIDKERTNGKTFAQRWNPSTRQPELIIFNILFDIKDFMQTVRPSDGDATQALARISDYMRDPQNVQNERLMIDWAAPEFAETVYARIHREKPTTVISEEERIGLSAQYYRKIQWEKGADVRDGMLRLHPQVDERVSGIIIRYSNKLGRRLHCINVGTSVSPGAKRKSPIHNRNVYIIECLLKGEARPTIEIARRLEWDTIDYLDHELRYAPDTEDTIRLATTLAQRHVAWRWLGIDQSILLGMNACVPEQFSIKHRYRGEHTALLGRTILAHFFVRPYVYGTPTPDIGDGALADHPYREDVCTFMGEAAAVNMIVGRGDSVNMVLFNDGDEILITDPTDHNKPSKIVVSDATGVFNDSIRPLEVILQEHLPKMEKIAPAGTKFRTRFIEALLDRYEEISADYCDRPEHYEEVLHRRPSEGVDAQDVQLHDDPGNNTFENQGSFKARYRRVLQRMKTTTKDALYKSVKS